MEKSLEIQAVVKRTRKRTVNVAKPLQELVHLPLDRTLLHLDWMTVVVSEINLQQTEN